MEDIQYPQTTGWSGWIIFASVIMFISGIVHIIYGLAGIFAQDWYAYTSTGAYIVSLTAWGWTILITGVLLMLTAMLLLAGNMAGRILGTILALASVLFNIGMIGAAPIWSIIAIVVDILIIYAIVAHGAEMKQYHQYHRQQHQH